MSASSQSLPMTATVHSAGPSYTPPPMTSSMGMDMASSSAADMVISMEKRLANMDAPKHIAMSTEHSAVTIKVKCSWSL